MTTESTDSATLQAILAEQKKIVALLEAGREAQQESLRFLRERYEQDARIRDESVSLQRSAVERFRKLSYVVLPLVALCVGLIVWLMVRYRMF
jgi:predicted ATPase